MNLLRSRYSVPESATMDQQISFGTVGSTRQVVSNTRTRTRTRTHNAMTLTEVGTLEVECDGHRMDRPAEGGNLRSSHCRTGIHGTNASSWV